MCTSQTVRSALLATLISSISFPASAEGPAPVASSPGSVDGFAAIADPCPTFSWGGVAGARSYELEIVRLPGESIESLDQAAIRHRISGAALSWTPSLEDCLTRGGRYGWTVRAVAAQGPSEWSQPVLIEISPTPSAAEVERALETLELYLEAGTGAAEVPADLTANHRASSPALSHKDALAELLRAAAPDRTTPLPGASTVTADHIGVQVEVKPPGAANDVIYGVYGHVAAGRGGAGVLGVGELDPAGNSTPAGVAGMSVSGLGVIGQGRFATAGFGTLIGGYFQGQRAISASGTACCNGTVLSNYAVDFTNRSTQTDPDVLGLWINKASVTPQMNYIAFFDTGGPGVDGEPRLIGEIEGDGRSGVRYKGSGITLRPTDNPGVCDAEHEGGVYYDASLDQPCYCMFNGLAGLWLPLVGGGIC